MAPTLRDLLLPVVDQLRFLPNLFGLRRYSVTIRQRTWSGSSPGEGTSTNTDTLINPPPKVRVLTPKEVAASGGTYREGDYLIEKITPQFSPLISGGTTSGGFTPDQLNVRPVTNNQDVCLVMSDDQGQFECEIVKVDFGRPFNYWLVATRGRVGVRG